MLSALSSMKLQYRCESALPKLAWCAVVDRSLQRVVVRHGSRVEVRPSFFIEGAWDGDFAQGDFTLTPCIFGSGAVVDEDGVTFVTSCSTTDSLYYFDSGGQVTVSNSLPFLLASIGDALDPEYTGYFEMCESITRGINDYERSVRTRGGHVNRLLFRNLRVTRASVEEIDKALPPRFADFHDYHAYLDDEYRRLEANIRSQQRLYKIAILSTQSRGYDTTAINAIASRYGVDRVFTCPRSKSTDQFAETSNAGQGNDDGAEVCEILGLEHVRIDRKYYERTGFPEEYLYYAAQAGNQDANFLEINSHVDDVAVLLTGVLGELWYDEAGYAHRPGLITPELKRFDVSGHGLSEARLHVGFIQVAVPYIGAQRRADIYSITNSAEMDPWRVNPRYDRPVPRRIAEERGVPRECFGQVKMGTVVVFPGPVLPYGSELRHRYLTYLAESGIMSRWQLPLWPAIHYVNKALDCRSPSKFRGVYYAERAVSKAAGKEFNFPRLWTHLNGGLFCFCVNQCVQEYQASLAGNTTIAV